jgi:LL-diaminopimelate aminotransferase
LREYSNRVEQEQETGGNGVRFAARLDTVPPYLFADIDRKVQDARARGVDVINLGIGDPDLPTPAPVVDALCAAARQPELHRYPDYVGHVRFRQQMAAYYARRFGVTLDPDREVMGLIGSKEGIAHLTWAAAGPGDVVLVPEPGYPVYAAQARLAGADIYPMPLDADQGFLPRLQAIPQAVAERARLMWINYPNNPTGAIAPRAFLEDAVNFCRQYDILLASDLAYSEVGFDGYRAPSILEVDGARDVAVEFFSLSKPYRMTGWRLGAAVGSAEALTALAQVKTNTDSGQFGAVQWAGVRALEPDLDASVEEACRIYQRRRDLVVAALTEAGLAPPTPRATFYLWVPTPAGLSAADTAARLLEEAAVVVTPGAAYGAAGEGYIRISLTTPDERLREACRRIAGVRF